MYKLKNTVGKLYIAGLCLYLLFCFSLVGAFCYVAVHFIKKFW